MKIKKAYIILIAILLIFCLVMFLLFGVDEIKKNSVKTTLIVGNDTVWVYSNQKWNKVDYYDSLNWKKYDVYVNNEKSGNYYLWYNNEWYAFDNEKNAVILDGDLLAISSNIDGSIKSFEIDDIDDFSYVYDVLEDNNLPTNSQFTSSEKIVLDFDGDGVEEEFYAITNAFPMDFDPEKIFSIVFMVKDEKIYTIYTNVSDNTGFNGCMPYFSGFIDANNDSKYDVILSCAKYSTAGVNKALYGFKDNNFKLLISNNK